MKSTVMVKEIYDAFKSVGAEEDVSSAAAQAVPPIENLATKADLVDVKADLADVKADLAVVKSDVAAVKSDVADLRGEFATLRGEFAELKGEFADHRGGIYRHLWLMGTGLLAAMVGLKLFD